MQEAEKIASAPTPAASSSSPGKTRFAHEAVG
jgi:hypothetical protein